MTPPSSHSPDDHWPSRLLAYADGQLTERERAEVEAALFLDPQLAELEAGLQDCSPMACEFWQSVAPPVPTEQQWAGVKTAIHQRLKLLQPRPKTDWRIAATILLSLAASIAFAVLAWPTLVREPNHSDLASLTDALEEYDVLPIATAEHMMVWQLHGQGDDLFATLDHPLPDRLHLATAEELVVQPEFLREVSIPTPDHAPVFFDVLDK